MTQAAETRPWRVTIAYLLSFSVFSKELLGVSLLGSVVDAYQIVVAGIGCMWMLSGSRAGPKVLVVWIGLLGASAVLLALSGFSYSVLLKQGIMAAVVYAGFAALIERTTPGTLATAYVNVCFGAAVFGLLQLGLSFAGVMLLMKVPGRLDSLAYEPSHYAIAIAPAVYLSLRSLWGNFNLRKLRELTIVASVLGTASLSALSILIVSGLVIGMRERGPLLAVAMIGLAVAGYANPELLPEEVQQRISAIEGQTERETKGVGSIDNLTLFSVVSNWEVAVDTLKKGRFLGNGFGGHSGAYIEYHGELIATLGDRFGFNMVAGHSLLIRVFSEFGLIGLFVYFGWILKGFRLASEPRRLWWMLASIYLVGRMFKLGGYFEVGMPLFMVAPLAFYSGNLSAGSGSRRPVVNWRYSSGGAIAGQ